MTWNPETKTYDCQDAAAETIQQYQPDHTKHEENQKWLTQQWQQTKNQNQQLHRQLAALQAENAELQRAAGPPELRKMRQQIVRELATLLPEAVKKARSKNGSPALLRLIIRSLRSL